MRSNREAGTHTHTHRHQLPQSINFVLTQGASPLTCVRDCQLWPLHKLINQSKHPDDTSFLSLIDKNVSLLSIIKALLTLWLSPIDKHVGVLSMLFHKKTSNFYTNNIMFCAFSFTDHFRHLNWKNVLQLAKTITYFICARAKTTQRNH